jgi:hypothetical protein
MLEGQALTALAAVQLAQDDVERAVQTARQALAVHRQTGHRPGESRVRRMLERAAPPPRVPPDRPVLRWRPCAGRAGRRPPPR